MDERTMSNTHSFFWFKKQNKNILVFSLGLLSQLYLVNCSGSDKSEADEPVQPAAIDDKTTEEDKGLSSSSKVGPPSSDSLEVNSEEGFWNRSIDDVIGSVNSRENDEKLKEDASLSRELQTEKIPLEINAAVQKWLAFFTGRDRERFQRFLNRGETYRPMIMAVLKDQGIPPELYFLAMIESGFAIHARSHAHAVGIWQFIKPTGRRYGLRVNPLLDERRDPVRATIAASLYLRDLNNVFQSWYLAMAAYNAGEGRILQAIMKAKTRNFWEIARRGYLPAETMNYIPKFLAAAIIGHHPEKYGFTPPNPSESLRLTSANVPPGRSLASIAEATSIPLDVLKESNPHLLKAIIPNDPSAYRLWLPPEFAHQAKNVDLTQIPKLNGLAQETNFYDSERSSLRSSNTRWHRIRRGESLEKIAHSYGMTTTEIKQLNRMRTNRVVAGQRLKVTVKNTASTKFNHTETSLGTEETVPKLVQYTVRPGDNLGDVAKKFGTSIHELKRINRLRHHTIYAGQILKIVPKG